MEEKLEELSAEKSNILYNLTLAIEEWLSQNNVNTSLSLHEQMIGKKLLEQTLDSSGSFSSHFFSRSPSSDSRSWDESSYFTMDSMQNADLFRKNVRYLERNILSTPNCTKVSKGLNLKNQKCIWVYSYSISADLHDKQKMDLLNRTINEINKMAPNLDDDSIVRYICADYQDGSLNVYTDFYAVSLVNHLKKIFRFDETLLKRYAIQIVNGLSYLHSKGICGLDLRPSNIFIDSNGDFKISDYLCSNQFGDLVNNTLQKISDYNWPSKNQKLGNDERRTDYVELANSILELANGKRHTNNLPPDFSQDASDFILHCKKKNITLKKLVKHRFLYDDDTGTTGANFIPMSPDQSMDPSHHPPESLPSGELERFGSSFSRYHIDFEELSLLGEGGFGKVFKCRNKLDNKLYAIKKIKFGRTDSAFVHKMLREVATLSSLHHQYVVRYYNTWIGSEEDDPWGETPDLNEGFSVSDSEEGSEETDDGYDTWDDEDFEQLEDDGEKKSKPKKILYIQMEYCTEKNLSKLIKERLSEEKAMKYFRQIIEGLNHIHSKGFIHRDLKPLNILIDSAGDIKIGDFGLAVASKNVDESEDLPEDPQGDDHTTGIGTHFYLAPEQRYERNYDQKVDIYSLGITFFEMIYFFNTEMERYQVLMKLRDGTIPDDFPKEHRDILRALLHKDPEKRPTTTELLSKVLKLEEDILKEAMNHFTKPNTTMYSLLMEKLFTLEGDESMSYMYDVDDIPSAKETRTTTKLTSRLKEIFSKHGGQYLETPTFLPKSTNAETSMNSLTILDQGGTLLSVSKNLTIPFVHHVLRGNIKQLRRFVVDKVHEKERGKPNIISSTEASFDIISSSRSKPLVIAEMLKILSEISRTFFGYRNSIIGINDYRILDHVISIISKDSNIQQQIRSVIKRHRNKSWKDLKKNLLELDKVTSNAINESNIERLVKLRGLPLSEAYKKLCLIFPNKTSDKIDFEMLLTINTCAGYFKVDEFVTFDITWMRKSKIIGDYGFYLQYEGKDIITGGCYDKLLKSMYYMMFKDLDEMKRRNGTKDICGVGIVVPLKRFVNVLIEMSNKNNLKSQPLKTSNVDVLIYSENINLLETRVKLALQLWSSNIKAEYLYDDKKPFEKLRAECKVNGTQWMVIIKTDNKRDNLKHVKVRNIEKRQEEVVEFDKVAQYIHSKNTVSLDQQETWNLYIEGLETKNPRQLTHIKNCFIEKAKLTLKYFDKNQEIRIIATPLPDHIAKEAIEFICVDEYDRVMDYRYRENYEKLKDRLKLAQSTVPFVFVFCYNHNTWHFVNLD